MQDVDLANLRQLKAADLGLLWVNDWYDGPLEAVVRPATLTAAQALLEHLASVAVERGCGRFEWCVLDWNERAIRFYEGMGATVMPDWRLCRVTGERLATFAQP